jgi:UDP-N-acetylglucosamine--N-acetylmuramyl-(pentapeptide) pyrophosphoryl-undecaprenol N-acetylglucosamine transferase
MIERVVVAGGGTGGHLFPGIAVVEELRRRNPQVKVRFIGTSRGIEQRVLPKLGEQLSVIEVRPLLGRSAIELVRNVSLLPLSLGQATQLLRAEKPDLVLGLGGYAAGPVLLTAAAMRRPTALLEQNAHVGLTNRLLARTVGRAYLTYPGTAARFGADRARVFGNPVRRSFVEAAQLALHDPAGVEARARRILVLGGSQGARGVNDAVPVALALADVSGQAVSVLHQTGEAMVDEVRKRYRGLGVSAEVVPFIDDMARRYAWCDLLVCRSGAVTVAEIACAGVASILFPLPWFVVDEQTANARFLSDRDAGITLDQLATQPEQLAELLRGLDRNRLAEIARNARTLGKPDAARRCAELCVELAHAT